MEIWKPIVGYEGLYEISSISRVKSFLFGKEKILKPGKSKYGYSQYAIHKNKIPFNISSHRLVAQYFIPNPDNLPIVCHKDETLDQNGFLYNGEDNLFWGTQKDNIQDCHKKGRDRNNLQLNHPHKGKFGKDNHLSKPIIQYTKEGEFIRTWDSIMDVQRELCLSQGNIIKCCKGEYKQAYGFIWRYLK